MSNPYRGRPMRARVDAAAAGYGLQNQNSWNAVASQVPSNVPPNNVFQPPTPVMNQPKQIGDPWDWGSENANNGNDSWNWSVDQQPEAQRLHPQLQQHQPHQQHPQQPQTLHQPPHPHQPQNPHQPQHPQQPQHPPQPQHPQNQFIPTYPPQKQTPPAQDYYKNLNGNNRPPLNNPHSTSGATTPRTISRESTPNHPDSYPPYQNYTFNQQLPPSQRPSSTKSSSSISDHAPWLNDQPHNASFIQQSVPPNQAHQTPPPVNNFNWNEQQALPAQNWQNQSKVSPYWQQPSIEKQNQYDSVGNQWGQQSQPPLQQSLQPPIQPPPIQQPPLQQPPIQQSPLQQPPIEPPRQPHPIAQAYSGSDSANDSLTWPMEQQDQRGQRNWPSVQSNPALNQWQNQNSETVLSQPQNYSSAANLLSWHRAENPDSQQWPENSVQNEQPSQWSQQENNLKETTLDTELNRVSATEWQQIRPPAHFASSNASTTSGSTANISNITEQTEERKKSPMTPATSSNSLNDSAGLSSGLSKAKASFSAQDSLQDQENIELDWNADGEWTSELSSGISQMNINANTSKNSEKSQIENYSIQSSKVIEEAVPDNVPVLPEVEEENARALETQLNPHDVANVQGVPGSSENASQAGYDQWYNQNTAVAQDNNWYGNDRVMNVRAQKWTPEPNVENYENIQQPSEFVNLEVVAPELQARDIYGSRDSINKETLDNDPKFSANSSKDSSNSRDFKQEVSNLEVPTQPFHVEQTPDNYEFASNDRNTFLETGELTDSHEEHEATPPSQDDENDEVPNDIPFVREVPGQSSVDPRRNDPTGQEQYGQVARISDPRRNDPSGQENTQSRSVPDRGERRDVPPGQERIPLLQRVDSDIMERRNDPSGRERSVPPQQSRNDPSGEERSLPQIQAPLELSETREIPGRGNEAEEPIQQGDSDLRQILGGASPNESVQPIDDRSSSRVVTGSQEVMSTAPSAAMHESINESRSKREEAVGASMGEGKPVGSQNRRESIEDGDDEDVNREESRERHREGSVERKRFEYERKGPYYDREREYDDDYYYERRRGADYDRAYNSREDLDRREVSYREEDRRHASRDDLDRHGREEIDRRARAKGEVDEREVGRRRADDLRREREDPRRRDREGREYDPRYPRDRDYPDRDRRRDDRRPRRYDDYDSRDAYRRDYYDDPYNRTSRPSSRSSYNDRDRDRDYYMRSRDPYYAYNGYGGYDYGANYSSNYYAYLENLRRTNPAAYSEWYHKYYANQHQQQHSARTSANYPEDRASVHSGRSSCDDRTTSEKRNLNESSVLEDQTIASSRLTPSKFSTAHVKGSFSIGSLLHILPAYPADGERAKVDIFRVDNLLQNDPIARELRTYPGPLIKGVTHKKTIIEYCESKIKAASNNDMVDRASYILLYELMIMLIQQNGNVVGVDIATLLLRNKDAYPYNKNQRESVRRESTISQRSAGSGEDGNVLNTVTPLEKQDTSKQGKTFNQMTDEFRNTLLYGLVQDSLEYAMDEGLWGHALFLASKLDKRTHASVMTRFANSLPANDPLQTLYQLHSGRVPASVTCVADPNWDDWRPHLAMIISNTSANPEINHRSITIMGDTLAARGDISAAHFCYILAQSEFGPYGANGVKLVLIGSNHHKPYPEFVNNDAIMLTEIYEYARNLSEPGFTLVDLQNFKFNLAVKMVDYGLIEKALLYIEQVAVNIVNEPSKYNGSFINQVYTLGNRIKFHDPVCKDSVEDVANLTWLYKLEEIVSRYQSGEIVQDAGYASQTTPDLHATNQDQYDVQQQHWNQQQTQAEYSEQPISLMEVPAVESHTEWQPSLANVQEPYNIADRSDQRAGANVDTSQYQPVQQQDYWNQQAYNQQDYPSQDYNNAEWQQQPPSQYATDQPEMDNNQQQGKWGYEPQPTISLGPSATKQYDPLEELDALDAPKQTSKPGSDSKRTSEKQADKKNSSAGGSWFGGLFSKLALKPKNQMILPDDSNPAIVWDPVAKKWMNKEEDSDVPGGAVAPPPKASDLGFKHLPPEPNIPPQQIVQSSVQSDESMAVNSSKLIAGSSNVYKLQKGRGMRANYIDVMNPNGGKSLGVPSNLPTPAGSPITPMAASSPQLFIPAPINDPNAPVDFLTPTPNPMQQTAENPPQELSRWSSTSSLSREVQSYTMRDPRLLQRDKGPMMFNPMDLKDRSQKNTTRSRYPPR
ncbi:uncharacterized protein LOC117180044 isoform X4 [Belonocnema kinseyi]|uniref:uncharacterized protein LOC117180044 isoform X4 n=1 Tax=Belonocnema kinseyi TaxID=2817044 RepID=UPI00143DD429|nr:uncharacterized protein LOC117180044 isoform X4 [Belonocnema kinseyi]